MKRILIVDDHPLVRQSLRALLEESGWLVDEAAHGLDAVERAPRFRPDLIILDLVMPGMNGLEAARVLHNLMPSVPIMMLSIFISHNVRSEAQAAGIRLVRDKGESLDTLVSSIRQLLNAA